MFIKKQFAVITLTVLLSACTHQKISQVVVPAESQIISYVANGKLVNSSLTTKRLFVNKSDNAPWNYSVYLPANFSNSKEYPVIYMLHGAGGDFTNWTSKAYMVQKMDRLIATKSIPPSIVVFPDGFTSYYIDGDRYRMQTAFIEELIPEITRNYPINKARQYHAVGGLSMGGFGASRFALMNPEYFSTALMLSPAVWTVESMPADRRASFEKDRSDVYGNPFDNERLRKHQYDQIALKDQTKWPVSFYVAFGSADTVTAAGDAEQFVQWAEKNQFVVESHKYNGYGHSWDFWTASVDDGLRFIGKQFTANNP